MESHRGTVHITSDERDQSKDAKKHGSFRRFIR